jgi:hypothetical protein
MTQLENNPMVQKLQVTGVTLAIILRSRLKYAGLVVLLLCGIAEVRQTAVADPIQHRWAGDVPIMSGLVIEPELGFAFDSPSGRIVMIFASTKAPLSKIMAFYGSTLVQLGWIGSNGKWIRKEEKLEIGVVQTERGPLWRIMLQPN